MPSKVTVDRDHLVARRRRGAPGLIDSNVIPRVVGDPVQLEQDPGHVDLVGHRLGQAEEVGDARSAATGLRLARRAPRSGSCVVGDLLLEVARPSGCFGATTRNQPAAATSTTPTAIERDVSARFGAAAGASRVVLLRAAPRTSAMIVN